jgi:hypothetical protein
VANGERIGPALRHFCRDHGEDGCLANSEPSR